MSRFNIPGLLGAIGELPSVLTRGLLGPLPVNPNMGLDPSQVKMAQDQSVQDMAFGMMATPSWNRAGGLMAARQNAMQGFQGRVFDLLKEQEIARMKQDRDKYNASLDTYRATLPEQLRPVAEVAGLPNVANAQIQSAFAPPGEQWRPLTPDEVASAGLDPSSDWQVNTATGKIDKLFSPPAPATKVDVNVGGNDKFLGERQKVISDQLKVYEDSADNARSAVEDFDALITSARKSQLTGILAPGVIGAGDFLRSFGIEIGGEALKDGRAFQSAVSANQMAWVARLGGARGMTDSENKKLAEALPKIADSVEARIEVITQLRKAEERKYKNAQKGISRKQSQLENLAGGGLGISDYEDLPAPPVPPGAYPTATNKATGETLIFKDGKWQAPGK